MVVEKGEPDRRRSPENPVLMTGDDLSAVTWVRQCGGTNDPRAAAMMRLLGTMEISGGWCFATHRIPGESNHVNGRQDPETAKAHHVHVYPLCASYLALAGGRIGGTTCDDKFAELARVLFQLGVEPYALAAFMGGWRFCCNLRSKSGEHGLLSRSQRWGRRDSGGVGEVFWRAKTLGPGTKEVQLQATKNNGDPISFRRKDKV